MSLIRWWKKNPFYFRSLTKKQPSSKTASDINSSADNQIQPSIFPFNFVLHSVLLVQFNGLLQFSVVADVVVTVNRTAWEFPMNKYRSRLSGTERKINVMTMKWKLNKKQKIKHKKRILIERCHVREITIDWKWREQIYLYKMLVDLFLVIFLFHFSSAFNLIHWQKYRHHWHFRFRVVHSDVSLGVSEHVEEASFTWHSTESILVNRKTQTPFSVLLVEILMQNQMH